MMGNALSAMLAIGSYAKRSMGGGIIADTFEWCKTCANVSLRGGAKLSNYGGECCGLKKKRAAGKECESWVRMGDELEKLYKEYGFI